MSLDLDSIDSILSDTHNDEPLFASKYPTPIQKGPLRFYDREMRCLSRKCGSSTFMKLKGVPTCMMHALYQMNEMLDESH